jgi:predicted secreted protein
VINKAQEYYPMKVNWQKIHELLVSYPKGSHNILAPCPEKRIIDIEKELGAIPDTLNSPLKKGHNCGLVF